jgi:hypothetical protein
MRSNFKSIFGGLCICASILLVSTTAVRAQVLAGSGEVAGFGGYGYMNYGDELPAVNNNHPFFGGAGGYSPLSSVTVFGEYIYIPTGSGGGETAKAQFFGGGARYNFLSSTKIVPYVVVAFGGDRYTLSGGGSSASVSGYEAGFGGGVSWYIGKNWGVRPEFRYVRQDYSGTGFNTTLESGGFFYQFGGKGKKM